MPMIRKVLGAAALTYVAATLGCHAGPLLRGPAVCRHAAVPPGGRGLNFNGG